MRQLFLIALFLTNGLVHAQGMIGYQEASKAMEE